MLSLALALTLALAPVDDPEPGFAIENLPTYPGEVTRTLSNGEVLVLSMGGLRRHAANGSPLGVVYEFPVSPFFLYPQSIAVDADETFAIVTRDDGGGAQTWRIDLGTGAAVQITTASTTSMVIDSPTKALYTVSSNIAFVAEVRALDLTNGRRTVAISFEPIRSLWALARDSAGDLYVASGPRDDAWEVRRFTAAQLASGAPLQRTDGALVADGLSDVCGLAVDPSGATVYAAEYAGNSSQGSRRLLALDGNAPPRVLATLTAKPTYASLEFRRGPGPAVLRAFQPKGGGALIHTSGSSPEQRYRLSTARPQASVTGVGTSGTGPFDLEVSGGAPSGKALFFYDLASNVLSSEVYYPLYVPLAFALSPATAGRVPGLLPLDATGSGSVGYVNATGGAGVWALQAIVFDAGGKLAGSTTTTIL